MGKIKTGFFDTLFFRSRKEDISEFDVTELLVSGGRVWCGLQLGSIAAHLFKTSRARDGITKSDIKEAIEEGKVKLKFKVH